MLRNALYRRSSGLGPVWAINIVTVTLRWLERVP